MAFLWSLSSGTEPPRRFRASPYLCLLSSKQPQWAFMGKHQNGSFGVISPEGPCQLCIKFSTVQCSSNSGMAHVAALPGARASCRRAWGLTDSRGEGGFLWPLLLKPALGLVGHSSPVWGVVHF